MNNPTMSNPPPPPTAMPVFRPRRLTLLGSMFALSLNVMI
jgi:hypothetical protein